MPIIAVIVMNKQIWSAVLAVMGDPFPLVISSALRLRVSSRLRWAAVKGFTEGAIEWRGSVGADTGL
jgi:hypothetical protein